MNGPPKRIIELAEAFAVFASIASGVKHVVIKVCHVASFDNLNVAEVYIIHDQPLPPKWCDECLTIHDQPLPLDAGFTLYNPPLPTPDKVFVNPEEGKIEPRLN